MRRWPPVVVALSVVVVTGLVVIACTTRSKDRCAPKVGCISPELPYCDCSVVADSAGYCRAEKGPTFLDCEQYVPPPDLSGDGPDGGGGGCTMSSTCGASTPICVANSCVACRGAQDDTECGTRSASTPRCHTDGRCVACRKANQADDCTTAAPVCEATTGECRACRSHDECDSRVCILEGASAGQCARASDVAYVNNRGVTVSACDVLPNMTRDGISDATAFCDVSSGVATSKRYVRVAGSPQPYGAISLTTTRDVVIIGPGKAAANRARLFSLTNPSVSVNVGGSVAVSITLDGMDLGGDVATKASNGVLCARGGTTSSATVVIHDSLVHDSTSVGIQSTDCAVAVTSSLVYSNTGGGINLSGSIAPAPTYVVENDLIYNNGTSGPAIRLAGNVQGRLRFLTIADNNRAGGNPAGVDCGGADNDQSIDFSILWRNTKSGGGSQLTTKCRTRWVDADETLTGTAHPDAFNADPIFVDTNTSNYRIQGTSPCVDKVPPAMVLNAPAVDVDLTARQKPQGGNYDVGAFEVMP